MTCIPEHTLFHKAHTLSPEKELRSCKFHVFYTSHRVASLCTEFQVPTSLTKTQKIPDP